MPDAPERVLRSCTTIVLVMGVFLFILLLVGVVVFSLQLGGL